MSAVESEVLADRRSPHCSDPMLPPGTNYCLCRGCGAYFLNVAAFERHRVSLQGVGSKRVCVQTPQMSDAGLERDPRGSFRLPKRKFLNVHLRLVR